MSLSTKLCWRFWIKIFVLKLRTCPTYVFCATCLTTKMTEIPLHNLQFYFFCKIDICSCCWLAQCRENGGSWFGE